MGDSIVQFSLIIGFYLASMGLGAFLSRMIKDSELIFGFVSLEMILGTIGAFSVPACYFFFAMSDSSGYQFFVLSLVTIIGTLTGFEIPLLIRIINDENVQGESVSDVLTFDYLGALGATLLFPFFLLPFVGLYRSSLLFGIVNIVISLITIRIFRKKLAAEGKKDFPLILGNICLILVIGFMVVKSSDYLKRWSNTIYKHPLVYTENSNYQRIELTKNESEFRLYLNGAIQFSSRDEYRYHEALVHVPLSQVKEPKKVLVLGGGEGLVIRELLKYNDLSQVTLVDIDPAITRLAQENELLKRQNKDALKDERVHIKHEDAFVFLKNDTAQYDAIIADLPDPTNETLSRLYTDAFYKLCLRRLTQEGVLCSQATSPHLTSNSFWSIAKTISSSGFNYIYPYQVYIPSFGNWGFVMAKRNPEFSIKLREELDLVYLDEEVFEHIFYFEKDIRDKQVEVNRLDKPILMDYYLEHWQSLQGEER